MGLMNTRAALTPPLARACIVSLAACGYQPLLGDCRPGVQATITTWPPVRRIAASASPWRFRHRPNRNASNG